MFLLVVVVAFAVALPLSLALVRFVSKIVVGGLGSVASLLKGISLSCSRVWFRFSGVSPPCWFSVHCYLGSELLRNIVCILLSKKF